MKLGRKPPDYSKPRLWAEDYFKASELPPFRQPVDYCSEVTSWPMYLNDTLGDCTCAGMAHSVGAWTQYAQGAEATFTDNAIETMYSAVSGYVPGNESTDNGATLQSVLQYMNTTGLPDALGKRHTVQAFAQLRDTGEIALDQALQLFGTVYLGINCPDSAMTQFENGQVWDYVKGSPIDGGHCIVLQAIKPLPYGDYFLITWGKVQQATRKFMWTYLEEAWAVLSPDWLEANGDTITGLDVAQLTADMQALG